MAKLDLIPQGQMEPVTVTVDRPEGTVYQFHWQDHDLSLQVTWTSPQGGWARNLSTGEVDEFYGWVNGEQVVIWYRGQTYVFSRPVSRRPGGAAAGGIGTGEIKAPMPGTILKILVEPGQSVEANAPLVIMESMKMEMSLTAPSSAVIQSVQATVGQLVEMNQVLVSLEAPSS